MKQGVAKDNEPSRTVYLLDDDPSMLRLLQSVTASIGVESRAFTSASDFFSGYRPGPSECLVCDIRMPDIDGIAVQQRLNAMHSTLPIIFLTGFAEVGTAVEAMRHGAFDFIEKPFSARALLGKIQAALESSHQQHAKRVAQEAIEARKALLTPRERSVVRLVVAGKSSREISEELSISVRTVENHRTRIMEKLHVDSTIKLVRLFL